MKLKIQTSQATSYYMHVSFAELRAVLCAYSPNMSLHMREGTKFTLLPDEGGFALTWTSYTIPEDAGRIDVTPIPSRGKLEP